MLIILPEGWATISFNAKRLTFRASCICIAETAEARGGKKREKTKRTRVSEFKGSEDDKKIESVFIW